MGRRNLAAGAVLAAAGLAIWLGAQAAAPAMPATEAQQPSGHLPVFGSHVELDRLLAEWKRRHQASVRERSKGMAVQSAMPAPVAPAKASMESITVTGSSVAADAASAESITNVQTAGVDEGGIVKRHGEHLVVLRRGRLFTVRIGGDALQPVSLVDAYAPGLDGDAWYDEMLISGDRVVVIGYSYARTGTEVGVFSIDARGQLKYLDTWHLRSNDYYSSRNYASRLVGSTLIFYTPLDYSPWSGDGLAYPAVAHWRGKGVPQDFRRLAPATRIYRADAGLDPLRDGVALHSVTRCELAAMPMRCTASAVLGARGREFYVARDAVYVWTQRRAVVGDAQPVATVLRMPLDGGPASALNVRGAPIDQLSFLEDRGHLNVLLQSEGRSGSMWGAEWGAGDLALLRVPLARFGDLRAVAPASSYRRLPGVPAGNRQNRYIGDWLVYGSAPWNDDLGSSSRAYALRHAASGPVLSLAPAHGVERIEAMGRDAVLIGGQADDLLFSSVALGDDVVGLRNTYRLAGATQGERRTHGFFYRNDGEQTGIVGLPVMRPDATASRGFLGAPEGGAAVTYLRNQALAWMPLGELAARPDVRDDACKASCVDWYGNARPIFIGDRVFALMGYELVEGRIADGRIAERRRVDFSPGGIAVAR